MALAAYHWDVKFDNLPKHPITSGVKPFQTRDEWYFHMRFPEGMKGVTPILSAVPPASTMDRPDGAHSDNPTVRKEVARGDLQHVAWGWGASKLQDVTSQNTRCTELRPHHSAQTSLKSWRILACAVSGKVLLSCSKVVLLRSLTSATCLAVCCSEKTRCSCP